MKSISFLPILGLSALGSLDLGCSDASEAEPAPPGTEVLELTDANNFTSQAALDLPSFDVAASPDLEICWSAAEEDVLCHPFDPAEDVNLVTLIRFLNLSEEDVEARLATGTLSQSAVDGVLEYEARDGETCAALSDFSFQGTEVDIEEEFTANEAHKFLLVLSSGSEPGVGTNTMTFVRPMDGGGGSSSLDVPGGCGTLDYSADLESVEPVVLGHDGPWPVDWRQLTRDGAGNDFQFQKIDRLLLSFYAGRNVGYLEEHIFDIEQEATRTWELTIDGSRDAELGDARELSSDEPFTGFDSDEPGVWLLALMCGSCSSPAPQLLTLIEPEGA